MGERQRRAAFLQPHRKLPRQRRGRVVLRDPEERDVLSQELCHQGRRQARGHRVHRGRLQPQTAPFDHRLPDTRAGHGVVLRADQADRRGASRGRVIPQASVSGILTQVNTCNQEKTDTFANFQQFKKSLELTIERDHCYFHAAPFAKIRRTNMTNPSYRSDNGTGENSSNDIWKRPAPTRPSTFSTTRTSKKEPHDRSKPEQIRNNRK